MNVVPAVAAISGGPMNLVIDAPTLPAPKTPSARPCRCLEYQAAFHAVPTENRLPAKPTRNASTSSDANEFTWETRNAGMAVANNRNRVTRRPP